MSNYKILINLGQASRIALCYRCKSKSYAYVGEGKPIKQWKFLHYKSIYPPYWVENVWPWRYLKTKEEVLSNETYQCRPTLEIDRDGTVWKRPHLNIFDSRLGKTSEATFLFDTDEEMENFYNTNIKPIIGDKLLEITQNV